MEGLRCKVPQSPKSPNNPKLYYIYFFRDFGILIRQEVWETGGLGGRGDLPRSFPILFLPIMVALRSLSIPNINLYFYILIALLFYKKILQILSPYHTTQEVLFLLEKYNSYIFTFYFFIKIYYEKIFIDLLN